MSSASPPQPHAASRHAWLMLGGSFATFTVSASFMHGYTVFLLAYIQEFHWTRAEASLAYSVSQLVGGFGSPLVGLLADRLGTRRLVLIGGVLLGAGLVGSAYATALWQVVVLYGVVMTMGSNCLGLVVFVPLLSRLFTRKRGMAIAIAQSASGFGRAISAPLSQLLITVLSWRSAYLMQAAAMGFLVLPLAWIFHGAETGGRHAPTAHPTISAMPTRHWTLAQAMRTPHFWLLLVVYLCTGLGSFFVSLHQLAFAVDRGFDPLYAAGVLGMGALFATPGIIITGTLSDIIGRELSAILAYGVSILGVVFALFITGPDQHLLLWLHACFFGLTWGARGPAVTAKTADLFPGKNLGTILGAITIGSGLGAAIGSWSAGWIFDLTGSYHLAFMLSIFSYLIGCVAFWSLRRPPA